jgi:DNA-binding winged helix-turn-helix (wHTH) protein
MRFHFGDCLLDDECLLLMRSGRPVTLRPKVFDLLVMLVRERERVVRREELFQALWSTTAVGAGSLSGLVNELRVALGETGRGLSSIRTVHARGYQFVARVRVDGPGETGRTQSGADRTDAAPATRSRTRVERWHRSLALVRRSGAHAVVAAVPEPSERVAWLARTMAESSSAGFVPRWGGMSGEVCDRVAADVMGQAPRRTDRIADSEAGSAGGERSPVALGLEVADPEPWVRAGGLLRLLDLLGQAPVLVIAAVAAGAEESVMRDLVGVDPRIESIAERATAEPVTDPVVDGAPPGESDGGIAGVLRALARADSAGFEAALRSMGFETVRTEPIRGVRRVEPTPPFAARLRDAEAI